MLPFARVSIIGLGLIGSSMARAIKANMPDVRVTGFDADPDVRERARALGFCDDIADIAGTAVIDAGLVVLC
ncbi:MAG TPA: prephenate/arogenate dehydrogenase family protein, partial [Sphingorhabdus sp.]|nr:prephenate/arogenate dehydrogenase family protein [Sphingorhabdus sp.]